MTDRLPADVYEVIVSRPYITLLLEQQVAQSSLLLVNQRASAVTAISTLLRCDSEQERLLLDLPYLFGTALPLTSGDEIAVSAHSQATHLRFTAAVIENREEEGMPCTLVQLPDQVEYYTSRADHRIDTSSLDVTLVLRVGSAPPLIAKLRDISARGIYINIEVREKIVLSAGDHVDVEILATSGCSGDFSFKVVRIRHHKSGMVDVGGEVIFSDNRQQMQLVHLVACLERSVLRQKGSQR